MEAKAIVLESPDCMQIREFELAAPQSGQILIKAGVTSVCASEYPDIPAFSRLAGQAPHRLRLGTYFFVNAW